MFTVKTKATFQTNIVEIARIVVVLWEKLNICKWYRRETKVLEEEEEEKRPEGCRGRVKWNFENFTRQ